MDTTTSSNSAILNDQSKNKTSKLPWIILGIIIFLCCACMVGVGIFGFVLNNKFGPEFKRLSDKITEIDAKYTKYNSNAEFKKCKEAISSKYDTNEIQKKVADAKDTDKAIKLAIDEVITLTEAGYKECAAKVDGK